MSQLNKAGDLAWCGLVALALAKRDGIVQSTSQENLFLTRWLATALKQRRFPRSVTPSNGCSTRGELSAQRPGCLKNSTTSGVPVTENFATRMTCSA